MMKRIKTLTLMAAFLIAGGTLSAKAKAAPAAAATNGGQAFQKGNFYLGGALGLGSGLGFLGGVAFIGNAEYAVTNDIGIGASVGYWSYTDETTAAGFTVKYKYSIIPIIVSGAWHFHIASMPKLDLGAGVSIGYYVVNASSEVSGTSSFGTTAVAAASASGVAIGAFGVVRYFVTDHIGLRGKLGYGITVAEVGVDFRF